MIYPQNFEQKIGFDQIRQLLKEKCLSTLGEERVMDMAFSDHFGEVKERLDQVTNLYAYSKKKTTSRHNTFLMYVRH